MNAHPRPVQLATEAEAPARPEASCFAEHLMQATTSLVPLFEAGTSIDAAALEDAFGASDTSGAWVWKDSHEAAEIAQILMLARDGAQMQCQRHSCGADVFLSAW